MIRSNKNHIIRNKKEMITFSIEDLAKQSLSRHLPYLTCSSKLQPLPKTPISLRVLGSRALKKINNSEFIIN